MGEIMIKIALPTMDRQSIEQNFNESDTFAIVTMNQGEVQAVEFVDSTPDKPGLVPGLLVRLGIDALVVGEVNALTIKFMLNHKIDVAIGAAGSLESVAIAYGRGELCSLLDEHSHDDHGCGSCSLHGSGGCGDCS
jgi:predicted Fe-Mo cluster-binding NifX family protein